MTTAAATLARPRSQTFAGRLSRQVRRLPLHLGVWVIMAIWLIPTFGLFVNSFRPVSEMSQSGWWTALFPPSRFTTESYEQVFATEGFADSVLNSLLISLGLLARPIQWLAEP